MSLWIIKGSDFVDALKRAFQEHKQANLDYLMTEFSIADRGVTKRQKIKFIDGSWSREAPKTPTGNGRDPLSKGCKKTLTLIRTQKPKITT
jgi:hypothetical protein